MGFLDDLPLVDRFSKPAYLTDGFVAVTNWHQDNAVLLRQTVTSKAVKVKAVVRTLFRQRWLLPHRLRVRLLTSEIGIDP